MQVAQASLCVEITSSQASSERGHAALWTISAWTTGGNLPDATLQLQATPADGGTPGFSFGCGKDDGTSSCDLGPLDATAPQRQLQAQLTTPVTASTVTSVRLTVTGSTANLSKDPIASATVTLTAPPTPKTSPTPAKSPTSPLTTPIPVSITSALPVGSLPSIPPPGSRLNPGGNAANLFPTLDPKPAPSSADKARTRPFANTSALPESAPIVGGQLAGLAALALAFVLAVTRLSIRRRSKAKPSARPPAVAGTATPAGSAEQPGTPPNTPEAGEGTPRTDGE